MEMEEYLSDGRVEIQKQPELYYYSYESVSLLALS